ncbi:MAG: hypothetical protein JSS65_08080 [Armatimonadetes bacterium]|nr:hypothetical protein [Armatimonadota bacterium]
MKRIGILLLAVCLGMVFAGCQQEPPPEQTKPDAEKIKASQDKAPVTKAAPAGGGMPPASPTGLDPTK